MRPGAKGGKNHAIGRSRGGRTTKIHALTDRACHPLVFLLTGGQVADRKAGAMVVERLPSCQIVLADKGYDSDRLATRYDRLPTNFLAAVCLAATVSYWL